MQDESDGKIEKVTEEKGWRHYLGANSSVQTQERK